MMGLLVLDVSDHVGDLAFSIGKGTITFLPRKWMPGKILSFNPFVTFCLNVLYQGGNRLMRTNAGEDMNVIRHAINLKHLVPVLLKYSGDVLMQFIFPNRLNKCLPVFYREYKLDVKLCVSISHILIVCCKQAIYRKSRNVPDGTKIHSLYTIFYPRIVPKGQKHNAL